MIAARETPVQWRAPQLMPTPGASDPTLLAAAALFAALAACGGDSAPAAIGASASANLTGPDGAPMGTVTLTQGPHGVLISADVITRLCLVGRENGATDQPLTDEEVEWRSLPVRRVSSRDHHYSRRICGGRAQNQRVKQRLVRELMCGSGSRRSPLLGRRRSS